MVTVDAPICANPPAFSGLAFQRLHGGQPIIAPTAHWWESGVTFNTAAVYLPRSADNDPIIRGLLPEVSLDDPRVRDGVVAMHYRARPAEDAGYRWTRSFIGLAVFTPDTAQLLARYDEPVIAPGCEPLDFDYLGAEDPRISRIGDDFYAVYCGLADFHCGQRWKGNLTLAHSRDLRHWQKIGVAGGDISAVSNKDGVLFEETIDGRYVMLHRPMNGCLSGYVMRLAVSDALDGEWQDCGVVLHAEDDPHYRTSWVGAGAVPIPLGDKRYLVIFHTGHVQRHGRREYDLDAAIFNFQNFDPAHPEAVLEARIDRIMVPETDCEVNGPFHDSVANVLFTCGAYVYGDDLYILYGGGDTYVMAARTNYRDLVAALEERSRLMLA